MSTTHEAPNQSSPAEDSPFTATGPDLAASGIRAWVDRNRYTLVGAVAVIAVLGGALTAWVTTRPASPATASTPIELPDELSGLPTLANDPLRGDSWQQKAAQAVGTAAWSARSYGSGGRGRTVRVVAARTDLTGKLEQAWAVGNGTQTGAVSCTHNTRLTPSGTAHDRPTLLVCWRTTSTLSVYAVVIDPKATSPIADADGAAAVGTAWKAAGGTD